MAVELHAVPTSPAIDVDVDVLGPGEVLALYAHQADELARIVESALAEEHAAHRERLRVLHEGHRRRTAVLTLLADALGEQHTQLDEVVHHLGVVDAELVGELEPVDLAPAPTGQDVLEAEVVPPAPYRCPLDADPVTGEYPTVLRRAELTAPAALTAIQAHGGHARRAWWRKLATRRPAGSRVGWW